MGRAATPPGMTRRPGKAIYKNVLGRTQAEAKAKLKAAIEETKSLDVTKVGKVHGGRPGWTSGSKTTQRSK